MDQIPGRPIPEGEFNRKIVVKIPQEVTTFRCGWECCGGGFQGKQVIRLGRFREANTVRREWTPSVDSKTYLTTMRMQS